MIHRFACMTVATIWFVAFHSSAMAAPFAYITNFNSRVVSVIDVATSTVVNSIDVYGGGYGVAVSPDGSRVYITNKTANGFAIIDTKKNIVLKSVPAGLEPVGIALNPAGTRVYVTNTANGVSEFDALSGSGIAGFDGGSGPLGLVVSPDGGRIYVAASGSNQIRIINPSQPNGFKKIDTGAGSGPVAVALNGDGSRVYVANLNGTVVVADTQTNAVVATIAAGSAMNGIALNAAGTRAYASDGNGSVAVIDTAKNSVITHVQVGGQLVGIAVSDAENRVYVADTGGDRVVVIDASTNQVVKSIPVGSQPIAFGKFITPSANLNYQGLWWNSPAGSESGWGINFAHQGDTIFASWFTYDLAGKDWWLVMTANRASGQTFTGTLYQTTGPAFNAAPFDPAAVTATAVGTGTLTFTDASSGTFSYTVNGISQIKNITRQVFGSLPTCTFASATSPAAATNYQDLWWASPAASESGWGVNFTHQGDTIFATWFTYDLDHAPMWLVVTAQKSAPGVYTGTLYRTTGPAFNAAPFNPASVVATPVGTAAITFSNGNDATFAYTVNGISQSKRIGREVFQVPGTVCQ